MTDNAGQIVVGVDGTAAALRAARWAGDIADRLAAPLAILTAEPYLRHSHSDVAAAARAAELADHRESAGAILRAAEDAVRGDHPALAVTTSSVSETADQALIAASRNARMVVLGCDDVTATGAVLTGSVTLATVASAECPVVAWRAGSTEPEPSSTPRPIVVGVDGTGLDGGALATAFELADRLEAPLRVIHSWTLRMPATDTYLFALDALEQNQRRRLNHLVEPWRVRHPRVNVTVICVPGKPGRALVEHAADAQLVIVGSRRRNVLRRGLFGSTSLNLLHHCEVPVALCPFVEDE